MIVTVPTMYNTRKVKPRFKYEIAADEAAEMEEEKRGREGVRNKQRLGRRRKNTVTVELTDVDQGEVEKPSTAEQTEFQPDCQKGASTRDSGHNRNQDSPDQQVVANTKIDNDNISVILNPANITGTEEERRQEAVARLAAVSARIYRPDSKIYYCHFCNKLFAAKTFFNEHMLSLHSGQKQHLCDMCGKDFGAPNQLKRHIRECHVIHGSSFTCKICSKLFTLRSDLITHLRIHVTPKRTKMTRYTCNICEKIFRSQLMLQKHRTTHPGIRPFACKYCIETFRSQMLLTVHEDKMHSTEENDCHACKMCKKRFKLKKDKVRHMKLKHMK